MNTMMYSKPVKFKSEDVTPDGTFEGLAAAFGNRDANGEIIDYGAFTKTLAEASNRKASGGMLFWPLVWHHDHKDPIGSVTQAAQDRRGLYIVGKLDLATPQGQRAYTGMKEGYLRGLSIGYKVIQYT